MGSFIRSAFAWALLIAIVLPLVPVLWLADKLGDAVDPRRDGLRKLIARWVSTYTRFTPLYRYRLEGRSHLPSDGAYVLVANHESALDPLSLLYLRTPSRIVVSRRLFRIPLARWFFGVCRHIPVKAGDRESGREALARAAAALGEGSPVAIFPEGELGDEEGEGVGGRVFRPGAFVLAKRAGVPVVPVLIEGAGRAWSAGSFVVRGVWEIRIAVLPQIEAGEVAATSADALAEEVRSRIDGARRPTRS